VDPVDVGTDPPAAAARERVPVGREPGEIGLTRRLRSFIRGGANGADPLADLIREHRAHHTEADIRALRRAYDIANQAHHGQMRKSGEPYITHPLAVAEILAELGMDTTALVAALLHDTVEDTSYTLEALYQDFGPDVATVVDGVTKVEKMSFGEDAEAETIRKMIIGAGRDVRVLVVKLADRLHNMRTLGARSPASRARVARATRDVLVPLCDRLGIQWLKRQIEDCVLRHLDPEAYERIDHYVKHRPHWAEYLESVVATARVSLKRQRVEAEVASRPRHYYSIWKDTVAGRHQEPFDLPRILVIVDGPDTDCYAALGAIHGAWRPVPGRFKDFIASPKNNLYRSLHTTVIGPDDRSVEVLIRTQSMQRSAEYGVAASFRYGRSGDAPPADQLPWLRRVLEWQREATDPAQFLEALHSDLVESQIHVFTLAGRKVLLPAESTPVDLAYVLDTQLGDNCVAAMINGRLAPLSSPLDDGDAVDILTRHDVLPDEAALDEEDTDGPPAAGPAQEWLTFVKTPHARLQISRWFIEHDHAQPTSVANKVRLGRAAVGLALRRRDRGLASEMPLLRLAGQLGYADLDSLLIAVAEHRVAAEQIVEELISLVDHGPANRTRTP
jgi:GTP pyrophosphokinase